MLIIIKSCSHSGKPNLWSHGEALYEAYNNVSPSGASKVVSPKMESVDINLMFSHELRPNN